METAYNRFTKDIIEAAQLCLLDRVDPVGFICRGCGVIVSPCSYRPENKKRAYFSAKHGHRPHCDIEGDTELVLKAQKERVTTENGFPARYPSKVVFRDKRPVTTTIKANLAKTNSILNVKSNPISKPKRGKHWTAETIRPTCRTFVDYPYDRDLPLEIPDISGYTYQYVFWSIKTSEIIKYTQQKIFYARISWKKPLLNSDYLEIELSAGEWKEKKLINPYKIRVNWKDWSKSKRTCVVNEIEATRMEAIEAKQRSSTKKGWLFFIGQQDENDPSIFHVVDHRKICSMTVEMIYP